MPSSNEAFTSEHIFINKQLDQNPRIYLPFQFQFISNFPPMLSDTIIDSDGTTYQPFMVFHFEEAIIINHRIIIT